MAVEVKLLQGYRETRYSMNTPYKSLRRKGRRDYQTRRETEKQGLMKLREEEGQLMKFETRTLTRMSLQGWFH